MKRFNFILVIVFFFQISFGQENFLKTFPNSYFGIYTGELVINSAKGIELYPMEFHLLPSDKKGTYNYTIVYGKEKKRQERKYTLQEKDKEKGIYILDENNGILLDCKVIDNKMYFLFEVLETLLSTFVTFYDDYLIFEIVTTKISEKTISGGTNNDIPEVISYPINVVQIAHLNKQ